MSSSLEDDPLREAKAYAASIYLMAGMPYLLLGGFGLWAYRAARKKQSPSTEDTDPGRASRHKPDV